MNFARVRTATEYVGGIAVLAAFACAAFLWSHAATAHAAAVPSTDASVPSTSTSTSTSTITAASSTASSSSTSSSVVTASSSSATSVEDTCGVTTDDIAQIVAVQNDPSLSASQEVVKELALRKALVSQVITCAQDDAAALRKALSAVKANGSAAQGIQSQLQGRIDDADHFYTIELSKLNDAGIAGTQGIAGEVLAWRQGTYAPLAGQVGDFVLWNSNQPIFATAQTRMDQTRQAVAFLEGASANAALQQAFNASYASFETATQENAAARQALQQFLPPDQSLTLIKESLSDLQATYQNLFTVSGIIQTLLPQ